MRLAQKQNGQVTGQFHFVSGPIYIGRGTDCQVLLKGGEVSRQHAVIYPADGTGWWLKDLCSANGTDVNGRPIERVKLKNGDHITVGDSTLEVDLTDETASERPFHLDDTLVGMSSGPRIIARSLESEHAPPIHMLAHRAEDFIQAASTIGKASGPEQTVQAVLGLLIKQFAAAHSWCGLRYSVTGPLTTHGGKTNTGQVFHLDHTPVKERVRRALEERAFLLITAIDVSKSDHAARSAMVAPLVGSSGNYGILYLDSSPRREPYHLRDLDYLMFLALHLGAVMEDY